MRRWAAVAAVAVLAGCGGDDTPDQATEVLRLEGEQSHLESDDFEVDGRWTLEWTTGESFNIFVRTPDGTSIDYVIADAPGGESSYRQGGTFYVEVDAASTEYTVVVTDQPD